MIKNNNITQCTMNTVDSEKNKGPNNWLRVLRFWALMIVPFWLPIKLIIKFDKWLFEDGHCKCVHLK